MKQLLTCVISAIVNIPVLRRVFWLPFHRAVQSAFAVADYQMLRDPRPVAELAKEISPDLRVVNGVFAGMRQPTTESLGSPLLPRLVGAYEAELHWIFSDENSSSYNTLVDVGCAEGYYAVGLALRWPHVQVVAYDVDPRARALCQNMAELNGVGGRVTVRSFCTAGDLISLRPDGRALIIMDCEGYEKSLITPAVAMARHGDDFLIEIHDCVDPSISSGILAVLNQTHEVKTITSVPDRQRPFVWGHLPGVSGRPYSFQYTALAEVRPGIMQWFWCRSRG